MSSSLCPITLEPYIDPVVAADGHTYERLAIQEWFLHSNISPVTGLRLPSGKLVPNHALRMLLAEYQSQVSSHAKGTGTPCARAGAVLRHTIQCINKAAAASVLAICCIFVAWALSLYVCEAITMVFRATACLQESSHPLLVPGITLCLCGVMVSNVNESLALALVVAGTPLAIASFCQGVWAVRGGDAESALFVSRGLVCAGVFFSAVGVRLICQASLQHAGPGELCESSGSAGLWRASK